MRFHHFLIAIGMIIFSTHALEPSLQRSAVQRGVQEVNERMFSMRGLHLELLKNCPNTIPLLADWEYEDWHGYDSSLTKERLIDGFYHCLNDSELPLVFVILRDSMPVGVISLNDEPEPELSDLADGNPWGGSFHIIPDERNQGLGEAMAKTLILIAKELGYEKIHFYTSNSQVVHWYIKRGAKIIDTRAYRGHIITVMEYVLGAD